MMEKPNPLKLQLQEDETDLSRFMGEGCGISTDELDRRREAAERTGGAKINLANVDPDAIPTYPK